MAEELHDSVASQKMIQLMRSPLVSRISRPGLPFVRLLSSTPLIFKQLDLKDLGPSKPGVSLNQPKIAPNPASKYEKIIGKLPKSLQKYGYKLVSAPMPYVVSFLTIHEISAVVPFLGLWYFFHQYGFLPTDVPSWMIMKGSGFIEKILGDAVADWSIQDRTKLIIEGATAYGIVKAMFIPRVLGSLLLTPFVARVIVEPLFGVMGRFVSRKRNKPANGELDELDSELKLQKPKKKKEEQV